jgi:hypothetical protein
MVGANPHLLACGGRCSAMTLTMMNPSMRSILYRCSPLVGAPIEATVVFDGLVSKPHLNGKRATIVKRLVGKYQVRLEGSDEEVVCKMENLLLVPQPSQPSRCAKCGVIDSN